MTEQYEWQLPENWDELLQLSEEFDAAWKEWKSQGSIPGEYVMPDAPVLTESYRGWACIHGPAETHPDHNHTGKSIEELILEINMIGGSVKISVDQWWGIWTDLYVENLKDEGDPNWIELEFKVCVQADNLHDGLEKVYDVVKSRWEFHKQKKWDW